MANVSENALEILRKRYYHEGENKPEEIWRRTAKEIAQAEKPEIRQEWENQYFNIMNDLDFLPNSPCIMNSGTNMKQFSACYVLPIEDTIESIFDSYKYGALISKSGGGTGFSYSKIRPKGTKVGSTNGVASGPISWMRIQDTATQEVKQGGKRRGANMGLLRVDHIDIEEFIKCKDQKEILNNFNISVALTDEFMEAVKNNKDFVLKFPNVESKIVNAKKLFDQICEHSWNSGDPGIIFIDEINRYNPTPHIGDIETTNPCGEQPLLPFEACTLGSINLSNMVSNKEINWQKLKYVTSVAVRFLDDVIDISEFPLPQITAMVNGNRKIGLGIMGWAHMLFKLNIPYNSEEALKLAEKVMSFINKTASETSIALGKEKGIYSNVKNDIHRNATRTTIAPTGTIGIIADTSGGIEPVFLLGFIRTAHSMDDKQFIMIDPVLIQKLQELNLYSEELIQKITSNGGSVQKLKEIPEEIQRVFVIASEISPEWHIKMQAAFQRYTNNAVSKTVNMSNTATIDDVKNAYLLAYELKCKGVTIYRDGSKENQPLTAIKNNQIENNQEIKQKLYFPKALPKVYGVYHNFKTGCGSMRLFLGVDQKGELIEIRTETSNGGCQANIETLSRFTSKNLGMRVDHYDICDQLKSAYCKNSFDKTGCRSCGHVIAKAIEEFDKQNINIIPVSKDKDHKETGQLNVSVKITDENSKNLCPDCGEKLIAESGCVRCNNCFWSKCN